MTIPFPTGQKKTNKATVVIKSPTQIKSPNDCGPLPPQPSIPLIFSSSQYISIQVFLPHNVPVLIICLMRRRFIISIVRLRRILFNLLPFLPFFLNLAVTFFFSSLVSYIANKRRTKSLRDAVDRSVDVWEYFNNSTPNAGIYPLRTRTHIDDTHDNERVVSKRVNKQLDYFDVAPYLHSRCTVRTA